MLRAVGAWIYDRDPYVPIQVRVIWVIWVILTGRSEIWMRS